jgi:TetR/AcrR family transcriptional repressor of mexJK operon
MELVQPVLPDRSARKRRAIVEAATALFLQHGYLGTSMDQIAAAAAVSKPTVYRFFADKERLFTEIVLGTLDQAGEPFRARLAALAGTQQLAEDLRQLARDYLATVIQPPVLQLRRLVIGASPHLPEVARAYYERAPEQTLHALAGCFEQLAVRGLLRFTDPPAVAAHFAFLVLGRALDKSLFCGDVPFTAAELTVQADAGAAVFLAAYGTQGEG